MLRVRNLAFQQSNGITVELDFDVLSGSWHAILAPSGSGKSGACAKVTGIDFESPRPTVILNGKDLYSLSSEETARAIALLPPQASWAFSLIGETVEDEIDIASGMLGTTLSDSKKTWILESLNLSELRDRSTRTLSGGECARVALATVLGREPKVIVLDQAFDSCDPQNRLLMRGVLAEWLSRTGGAVVEFATSWSNSSAPDLSIHLSALTRSAWVQGTPDEVWSDLGPTAADFFEGLDGLAARTIAHTSPRPKREATIQALAIRLWSGIQRSQPPPAKFPVSESLTVNDLSFSYGNDSFSLKNVSFFTPTGTITALLGPNGCGKTTLLRCIGNLLGPWQGSRITHGQALPNDLLLHNAASHLIYAFQNPDDQIYRSTVSEELLECRNNLKGTRSSLTSWEQEAIIKLGFSCLDRESPFSLPLSRKRLLMIASSLLATTKIVLLDEPTAWLDLTQKRSLAQALQLFKANGGTVIMISHDMDFVGLNADRLLRLSTDSTLTTIEGPLATESELPVATPAAELSDRAGMTDRVWKEIDCMAMLK